MNILHFVMNSGLFSIHHTVLVAISINKNVEETPLQQNHNTNRNIGRKATKICYYLNTKIETNFTLKCN